MPATRTAPHKPTTLASESRLSYRLRKLSTGQRNELLQHLGMSRTTLFARMKAPGTFTLDEAATVTRFLEGLDDCAYDVYDMMRPIEL